MLQKTEDDCFSLSNLTKQHDDDLAFVCPLLGWRPINCGRGRRPNGVVIRSHDQSFKIHFDDIAGVRAMCEYRFSAEGKALIQVPRFTCKDGRRMLRRMAASPLFGWELLDDKAHYMKLSAQSTRTFYFPLVEVMGIVRYLRHAYGNGDELSVGCTDERCRPCHQQPPIKQRGYVLRETIPA